MIHKIWRVLGFVLILLVIFSSSVSAATVTIQDDANLISASDESSLRSKASSFPYNVTIYTSNSFKSVNDFTNEVNTRLSRMSGNGIIVGVSGNLKNTRVAAKGIGIDSPEATQISQAANSFFSAGNYGQGFDAMLSRTNQLSRTTIPVSTSRTPNTGDSAFATGFLLGIANNSTSSSPAFVVGFILGIANFFALLFSGIIK